MAVWEKNADGCRPIVEIPWSSGKSCLSFHRKSHGGTGKTMPDRRQTARNPMRVWEKNRSGVLLVPSIPAKSRMDFGRFPADFDSISESFSFFYCNTYRDALYFLT